LLFNLATVTHGQFYRQNFPTDALLSFYQQNITDRLIEFKHDNSTQAPAYQVSVTDGRMTSPWQSALIDFDASPILLNNTLIINQGQTVRLTSVALSATHPGGDDQMLLFDVNNVQHGKFSRVTVPDQAIFNFYQKNITDGLIQFSHDNSTQPPGYTVSVSDGRITTPAVAATIDFDVTPILEANQLTINQGQVIILTENNLRATQGGSIQGALTFIINDLQYGQFTRVDNQQSLLNFQQQNITDRRVQFIHDNSITAPGYRVSVSDGRVTSEPSLATIAFDPAPILVNNQLIIGQDQTVTLTTANLLATHNGTTESTLEFMISQVQNGGFIVPNSQKTSETGSNITFSQQQILDQTILFYQQGSATPAYRVSVSDSRITLPPASANVTFNVKPVLTKNQFLVSTGQPALLTSDNLAATHGGQQEEELQFLVSGTVSHGQFEKRNNPGAAILSFYQQDIMQQNIQFVPDNSLQTPDCRIKVFDSSTDLSSDAQESSIILVTQNNFRINQGETFTFSDTTLKASSNQGHDEDIIFTPISGTVQHGYFALAATPSYVISSFQQSQISQGEIVFVPDGSAQAPSCYLSIAASQSVGASGTVHCEIDFDTPPVLQHAYLKTSISEVIKMSDVNLKAVSSTVSPGILSFEISENQQGYFADNNDWQTSLTNFTQQRVLDNQIVFITDDSGMAPKFKVSVWDGRMHCEGCPQTADVVFQSEGGATNSNLSELIKNAVIGAASSGVVGLLFYALKYRYMLNLQRSARATLNGQAQSTYTDDLLLPIAREIFARIKITGCFGYISKRQYNEYVGAVSVIVSALETKGVIQSAQWSSLSTAQTQRIIDAIAAQCKEIFGNKQCCSLRTFTGFYRPDATPKMIRDQANTIATAVQESLADTHEVKNVHHRDVRLTRVSSSLNDSGLTAPLLQ
jgi:Cadherin-like